MYIYIYAYLSESYMKTEVFFFFSESYTADANNISYTLLPTRDSQL